MIVFGKIAPFTFGLAATGIEIMLLNPVPGFLDLPGNGFHLSAGVISRR